VLSAHDRVTQATEGFKVLGADAAPAIPRLVRLLDDRESHQPAIVLAEMGRLALPEVLVVLTNRNTDLHQRAEAAYVIELMETNASDTVEVLKGCLSDVPVVAAAAASALPEVTTNRSLIISALTNALVSPSADLRGELLDALGECGAEALPVICAVKARLVDEDGDVRWSATNALNEILGTDRGTSGTKRIVP
jgi:HEAT repeat protein